MEAPGSRSSSSKLRNDNAHVGSLADIVTYPIDISPGLNITKVQLLDAILKEIASGGYDDSEQTDFWNDFDNLQKAKIIR